MLTTSLPFLVAVKAVVTRNGLSRDEGRLLERCLRRAIGAIAAADRRACAVRLVRQERFISVVANNHLAIRAPAWDDQRNRLQEDLLLIWPQAVKPSVLSERRFRREAATRFKLIPHFNLGLTWEECLAFTRADWRVFRTAVHDALTLARTRKWTSNVRL
jgi:hypothetical protein